MWGTKWVQNPLSTPPTEPFENEHSFENEHCSWPSEQHPATGAAARAPPTRRHAPVELLDVRLAHAVQARLLDESGAELGERTSEDVDPC